MNQMHTYLTRSLVIKENSPGDLETKTIYGKEWYYEPKKNV
jgi:hypothetical protein